MKTVEPATEVSGKIHPMGTYQEEEALLAAWNTKHLASSNPHVVDLFTALPFNITNVNSRFAGGMERIYPGILGMIRATASTNFGLIRNCCLWFLFI